MCIRKNLNILVNGTMKLIHALQKNYNLILLSDHLKEWMEYILENNKDIDVFKHRYFSFETGKIKRDKDIFKLIIEEEKIKPEETIFIDDYEINVQAAIENGIYGIVFQNAIQLETKLKEINIL